MTRPTRLWMPALCLLAFASQAGAGYKNCNHLYQVTIKNLTYDQVLSPPFATTHAASVQLFQLGEPASDELALLAEAGDSSGLTTALMNSPAVCDAETAAGPVPPGGSISLNVHGSNSSLFSVATMLVNTNDAFAALSGARLAAYSRSLYRTVPAYDAGSEVNDESCSEVPGPACGGAGLSAAGGEGFVHIHRGIHGVGDLDASRYDWRNPVAAITIRRIQ